MDKILLLVYFGFSEREEEKPYRWGPGSRIDADPVEESTPGYIRRGMESVRFQRRKLARLVRWRRKTSQSQRAATHQGACRTLLFLFSASTSGCRVSTVLHQIENSCSLSRNWCKSIAIAWRKLMYAPSRKWLKQRLVRSAVPSNAWRRQRRKLTWFPRIWEWATTTKRNRSGSTYRFSSTLPLLS